MPYKVNEARRHKIPPARYKVENWAEYDAALVRRSSLTLWVTPEAIAAWAAAPSGRRGRPQTYSNVAIEAGLMLRLAFGRPWRQTEGLLGSILGLLGLELPVPVIPRCRAAAPTCWRSSVPVIWATLRIWA